MLRLGIAFVLWQALTVAASAAETGAVPVRIVKLDGGGFRLERGGEPYLVRGVGGSGSMELLKQLGGNSVRTWGVEGLQETLDRAHEHGLTVCVGIWLGHRRHGFDYNNADQVAKQQEAVRETVEKFKNHPAVLLWGLGNEMEGYEKGDDAAIWSAINNLAAMVKRIDPHHPTMTVTAEIGGERVKNCERLCPDVDILGINCYAGGATLPKRYRTAGGVKPYIVTELGPPGPWETPKNAWGAAPELTSTEKAAAYRKSYEANVGGESSPCLGTYAFLWGQKQEATATWFGILLDQETRLAQADALAELWTGKPPANRCPMIESLTITGPDRAKPGTVIEAKLAVADPENDALTTRWVLQAEPSSFSVGGDAEAAGATFADAVTQATTTSCTVKLPEGGGGYRLLAYVTDGHGGAATANLPLYVDAPVIIPPAKRAELPLVIYDEPGRSDPAYVPTGWMGNTAGLKLDPESTVQPHAGKTCLQVSYEPGTGWAGVVWQSPPSDWGDKPGGWDLTGAKRLTFWARGETGDEKASFEFGLLGDGKKFRDSAKGKLGGLELTGEWKQYAIELGEQDLSRIKTGFAFVITGRKTPLVFYLDDVHYE
jgi:hypothetical protein